jgi:hypothetical protein
MKEEDEEEARIKEAVGRRYLLLELFRDLV